MNWLALLAACPMVYTKDHIERWISGVSAATDCETEQAQPDEAPPRKRLRRLSPEGRKRPGSDSIDGDPGSPGQLPLPQTPDLRPSSPIKTRVDLQRLAKPVYSQYLEQDGSVSLPSELRSLYVGIRDAADYQIAIVPNALRNVSVVEGPGIIPEHSFSAEVSTKKSAEAILAKVRDIKIGAARSTILQRDESAWNQVVHYPLLALAFDEEGAIFSSGQDLTVRVEPTQSAMIARDSIPQLDPRFFGPSNNHHGPILAWSAPESSTISIVSEQSVDTSIVPSSRETIGKVDYVIVLDIANTLPLRNIIRDLTLGISFSDGSYPHVNQTKYAPVVYSPIALSIDTQSGSAAKRDPLLQLGIWTASWHKRMHDLRSWMLLSRGLATDISQIRHPTMIPVPLISVIGHNWMIYFACDTGDSLVIHGPVQLGSTIDTIRIFALIASLKLVKEWILTEFYKGLITWFSPDNVGN
ncbi:hypothetical protein GGR57DRAFT_332026 [Xylariaceae sp. FL1272]|nr:hypothetical protein GGR57DRAFT_332026 [Xylariaceae sp. FL1272]